MASCLCTIYGVGVASCWVPSLTHGAFVGHVYTCMWVCNATSDLIGALRSIAPTGT